MSDVVYKGFDKTLPKYTVAQLKTFLKERGLKVGGRKKELIKRLEEALKEEQKSPTPEVHENESQNEDSQADEPEAEKTESKKDSTPEPMESQIDQETIKNNPNPNPEPKKEESIEEAKVEKEEIEMGIENTTQKSMQDEKVASLRAQLLREKLLKQSKSVSKTEENETKQNDSEQEESVKETSEESQSSNNNNEKNNDDWIKNIPIIKKVVQDLVQKPQESEEEKPKEKSNRIVYDNTSKSNSLLIAGFRRPLQKRKVEAEMKSYGELKTFWMNDIKTHCIVIYENGLDAMECFSKLNNTYFPRDIPEMHAGLLTISFIKVSEANNMIEYGHVPVPMEEKEVLPRRVLINRQVIERKKEITPKRIVVPVPKISRNPNQLFKTTQTQPKLFWVMADEEKQKKNVETLELEIKKFEEEFKRIEERERSRSRSNHRRNEYDRNNRRNDGRNHYHGNGYHRNVVNHRYRESRQNGDRRREYQSNRKYHSKHYHSRRNKHRRRRHESDSSSDESSSNRSKSKSSEKREKSKENETSTSKSPQKGNFVHPDRLKQMEQD